MRTQIKNIILEEFSKLVSLIQTDFQYNYDKKVNNFLLSQMDARITAGMVFVSSFESKSGFALETCAKRIARIKFGVENVPSIVNPRNIKYDINNITTNNGQIVITNVQTDNGDLRGKISAYRANNMAFGRGTTRKESGVTLNSIKDNLLPLSNEFSTNKIYVKPVDLAFYDGENWNILEIKAGGDLDSSNAPSNIEKLLNIYVDMGIENCNVYFATLYNKDGEGNAWKGTVKKHMHYPSMFLIGANFWNMILPIGVSFSDFAKIYQEALVELDLNQQINKMISQCVQEQ